MDTMCAGEMLTHIFVGMLGCLLALLWLDKATPRINVESFKTEKLEVYEFHAP